MQIPHRTLVRDVSLSLEGDSKWLIQRCRLFGLMIMAVRMY
jgi:hypothetical protein